MRNCFQYIYIYILCYRKKTQPRLNCHYKFISVKNIISVTSVIYMLKLRVKTANMDYSIYIYIYIYIYICSSENESENNENIKKRENGCSISRPIPRGTYEGLSLQVEFLYNIRQNYLFIFLFTILQVLSP